MSTESPKRRSIAIAVTGASGAVYATRTMAALLERGCHLELVISDYGRRLLRDELGDAAAVDKLLDYLASKYGQGVRSGTYTLYSNRDLGARIASGSQGCDAMVVVPCSMKSLAGIANGGDDSALGFRSELSRRDWSHFASIGDDGSDTRAHHR